MSMCGCASPHITAPRQGYCSFWYSAQSRKMLELHTWQLFSSCVHAKLQTLVHIIKKILPVLRVCFFFWLDSHIRAHTLEAHGSTVDGLIISLVISVSSPRPLTFLAFSDGSHRGSADPFFSLSLSLALPLAKMTSCSLAVHVCVTFAFNPQWDFYGEINKQTTTPSLTLALLMACAAAFPPFNCKQ